MQKNTITGFSRLSKQEKANWAAQHFFEHPEQVIRDWASFSHPDEATQKILDGLSENTLSNYPLPYGIAPNFLIDGKAYAIPMVIEESSVVAAASSAAKFWMDRGGFHTEILDTKKLGQVHFSWSGEVRKLYHVFDDLRAQLLEEASPITANMEKRGGGIRDIRLMDMTHLESAYFQLMVAFDTCDSMGANFINSVLESFADTLQRFVQTHPDFSEQEKDLRIIMAILSNYTPECLVRAWVECPIAAMDNCEGIDPADFAEKFHKAVRIAHIDPYRAATHNKGIFNGIDAVVLATGNDFRAIEACGHAFAARDGHYRSLSDCSIEQGIFRFWLDIPLAVGTVGGLTTLHPLARRSLELLGNPGATELMSIIASAGLAQNFAALRSLITTGIQKGHMKMHLMNILNHLGATPEAINKAVDYFSDKVVSFTAVREFIQREG
mgnify:CR=1 FL=1